MEQKNSDKPVLLKAVELILADPADIKKQVAAMEIQCYGQYGGEKSEAEIRELIVNRIIKNYSYYTAFAGGATALAGIIPGLGQLIATVGGATADAALTMKWEIEMVMAIAAVYKRDITLEDEKLLCFLIAGLGVTSEAAKKAGKEAAEKAFIKMLREYMKGPILAAVKEVFKKIGVTFTRKAVEKAVPFGVGVILGAGANKLLTQYVGGKAKEFYRLPASETIKKSD